MTQRSTFTGTNEAGSVPSGALGHPVHPVFPGTTGPGATGAVLAEGSVRPEGSVLADGAGLPETAGADGAAVADPEPAIVVEVAPAGALPAPLPVPLAVPHAVAASVTRMAAGMTADRVDRVVRRVPARRVDMTASFLRTAPFFRTALRRTPEPRWLRRAREERHGARIARGISRVAD